MFDKEDNLITDVPPYPAKFEAYAPEPEGYPQGYYVVTFRDFPEAITSGDDEAEAILWAQDCLYCVLYFRWQAGEVIPDPSAAEPGERMVKPVPLCDSRKGGE